MHWRRSEAATAIPPWRTVFLANCLPNCTPTTLKVSSGAVLTAFRCALHGGLTGMASSR